MFQLDCNPSWIADQINWTSGRYFISWKDKVWLGKRSRFNFQGDSPSRYHTSSMERQPVVEPKLENSGNLFQLFQR